jgi:outer membrane protein assembly factor BamB
MLKTIKTLLFLFILLPSLANAKFAWQFQTDGMVVGKPIIHQDRLYVTGGKFIYALNKKGQQIWKYNLGAKSFSNVTFVKNYIFVLADNGLHALNLNGEKRWFFSSIDKPLFVEGKTWGWGDGQFKDDWAWYRSSPIIVGNKVIFGNAEGTFAINLKSGKKLWHAKTGVTHTQPAQYEDRIIIGSWDNRLYGLDIEDGNTVWSIEGQLPEGEQGGWQGWNGFNLSPVINKGIVYVGTRGGIFYAINAVTGVEQWSAKHPTTWVGSAAVVDNGEIYYGLSDGYSVIGRNAKSGSLSLLFKNKFYNFAQPQVNKEQVFVGNLGGQVFAINKLSGEGKRIFSTNASKKNFDDMVKVGGGLKGHFYVKGAYTNENAGKDVKRMLNELDSILSMTLNGNMLYLGSATGQVYAIEI